MTQAISGRKTATEAFESIRDVIDEALKQNGTWVFEDLVTQ